MTDHERAVIEAAKALVNYLKVNRVYCVCCERKYIDDHDADCELAALMNAVNDLPVITKTGEPNITIGDIPIGSVLKIERISKP